MALAVTTYGNPELPPLFCIHGFAASARAWEPFAETLKEHFCIYAVDLPGFGKSPAGSYELDHLLNELGRAAPETAVWVGWSLGGMLAQAAAARFPDRVLAVVSVAASLKFVADKSWPNGVPEPLYRGFMDSIGDVRVTQRRFAALQVVGESKDMLVHLKWLQQNTQNANTTTETLRASLELLGLLDLRKITPLLSMPVMHLLSANDAVLPKACSGDIAKLCKGQTVNMVPDAAHAGVVFHPQKIANALMTFVLAYA